MNYFIVDAHCDTLSHIAEKELTILESDLTHININKLHTGKIGIQVFAVWPGSPKSYISNLQKALLQIDAFYQLTRKYQNDLYVIYDYKDIEFNNNRKIGALLSIEGGDVLNGEIANLRILYRLGVRLMTLTWNYRNEIADGVLDNKGNGGLSLFGNKVISEMNNLGMIIDLSHISESGFWDVLSISDSPVIASHSNAKAICNHPRNLSNRQIIELSKIGGVIGINFYPPFLNRSTSSIKDIIRNVEYIVSLAGIDCIGFGSDFDGIDSLPDGINGPQDYYFIINELLKLNYKEEDILKICYKNFMRVFKDILKNN